MTRFVRWRITLVFIFIPMKFYFLFETRWVTARPVGTEKSPDRSETRPPPSLTRSSITLKKIIIIKKKKSSFNEYDKLLYTDSFSFLSVLASFIFFNIFYFTCNLHIRFGLELISTPSFAFSIIYIFFIIIFVDSVGYSSGRGTCCPDISWLFGSHCLFDYSAAFIRKT